MIASPGYGESHPSRFRECQRALVADISSLVDRAAVAGWKRQEVIAALMDLLDVETAETGELLRLMADYLRRDASLVA